MKTYGKLLILLILATSLMFACKKSKNTITDTTYTYNVTLSGANEVPANTSTATGTFTGTYRKSTRVLSFTLSYSGITPTDWHIHKGAVGVSGLVVFPLDPIVPSPLSKSITLTPAEETDLLNGSYYVNIHSVAFPGGEIRAQIAGPTVADTTTPGGGGY